MKDNESLQPNKQKKVNALVKKGYVNAFIALSLVIAIAMGITAGTYSLMKSDEDTVVELWGNTGDEYYYSGMLDEAINEYSTLQKEDKWPEWTIKIAQVYSLKGEVEKANSLIREAVILRDRALEEDVEKYKDRDKQFINDVVYLLINNNELDEAISFGKDYLEDHEDNNIVKSIFYAYMLKGNTEQAKKIMGSYQTDEESAFDLARFAKMQIVSGNIEDGLKTLRKAWQTDSDEIEILNVLNDIAMYDKNVLIKKINTLNTNKDDVYNIFLAAVYANDSANAKKAGSILENVKEEISQGINYNIIKAEMYNTLKDEKSAKEAIDEILDSKEESYAVYYFKAWNSYYAEEYDQALEYCKKSIDLNREFADNYGLLMTAIKRAKGETGIEAYYNLALQMDPFNYAIALDEADYYENYNNNYDKAEEALRYAIKISKNGEIYYRLAQIEIKKENSENAIKYYKKAIELDVTNLKYYRAVARLYLADGQYENCIETLRTAYQIDDTDVLVLNDIACYYLTEEENIERAFSNIEAAYNEIPKTIDADNKAIITNNYDKIKKAYNKYNKTGTLNIPEVELCK